MAQPEIPWHQQTTEAAIRALASQAGGLQQTDAAERLARHGANTLPHSQPRSGLKRFLQQCNNPLIYVLLTSGGIVAALGHWADCAVIMGVVLVNASVGFVQEGKAEAALDAIRHLLSPSALVLRDGVRQNIPAAALVPGDWVVIASGDRVPGDLRLLDSHGLFIDEALLTGESLPLEKQTQALPEQTPLADRSNMAWSGTLVSSGQGLGIVVATGASAEIGQISEMVAKVTALDTPLLRKMRRFSGLLTGAIILLTLAVLAFGVGVRDYSWADMLIAAVGLAVAAIPEGLPAIVTITLALGVQQMSRRHAIVRHLPSVEALGAVTVICTDKTGTLTRNEMFADGVIFADQQLTVSGEGYSPKGGFTHCQADGSQHDLTANPPAALVLLARACLLCNDAQLRHQQEQWQLAGDPTEGALLALAAKAGLELAFEQEAWPRTDVIPFESQHRLMATLNHDHTGQGRIFLKGAPERILPLCQSVVSIDGGQLPLDLAHWQAAIETAAQAGRRLLAVAVRDTRPAQTQLTFDEIEAGNFQLLALVALSDPPRPEAIAAVNACRQAGIRVKMITGDHATTASAIGRLMRLAGSDAADNPLPVRTITGEALDALDETGLAACIADIDVFARASPAHKLRLVSALQVQGEVVAMTGDGVNDAPALKRADIGVAMGKKGTEAAKEAADIVLADDNFASISAAVEEGRRVYDNIRKAILFILPTSGGEAGILLTAILLGITLPITPVQILWVNMVTAITLALAIAFEPAEENLMQRPPLAPNEALLTPFMLWRVLLVTLLMVAGGFGLFLLELDAGASLETARTAAINLLVMGEIVYLINCQRLQTSIFRWRVLTGNPYVAIAIGLLAVLQGLLSYWPPLQALFGTAPLALKTWGLIAGFGALLSLLVEFEKTLIRHFSR